jgi:hypothetical protein
MTQPATAVTRHPEDARVLVVHAYLGILGRAADSQGLFACSEFLEHGGDVGVLCRELFTSAEFTSGRSAREPEQLLHDLYLGILSRAADEEGFATSIGQVRAGKLDVVAAVMLNSVEFEQRFLGAE